MVSDHIYSKLILTLCESVSQVVDNALKSATEAQNKTSKKADNKFKEAADALSDYEKKCKSDETVAERMAAAEAKDKSSIILKTLPVREEIPVRDGLHASSYTNTYHYPQPSVEERTVAVEFVIRGSLTDHSPIIVKGEPAHRCGLQY